MPIPQFSQKKPAENWQANKKYFMKNKHRGFLGLLWHWRKAILKATAVFIILFIAFIFYLSRGLPDPNKLIDRQIAQSTKIYDRTGKTVLYEIAGDEKRTLVPLSDIPLNVRNATIAIEDKDFYKHGGFSVWAIFRTAVTDVLRGQSAGASTLTQQFVKNAILSNEKTFTRKIKELILAYQLEKRFSKDEILQMYLNEIPYGSTAYGVEAASQKYFAKNVKDVNLAEAAILASLPQAPSRYSPYGTNKDLLIARQHYVLDQMAKQGYITQQQADEAKNTPLVFKKQVDNLLAPHFVMYIKDLLSEKYGQQVVEQGGLKITTTLDLDKQKAAEAAITEKADKNQEKYKASNAALVSIDPKTGQVLAMVGSKDYYNEAIDGQVNIATSPRQPGSSFKPMVYAAAFIKGFTPNTILYDVLTNFSTDPAKPYQPHNYDGKEHGPVTIRKALAGSLNIPAVKALYLAGINNVISLANDLGYSTLKDKDRFGLSLVLGGGEVSLLEHTNAYSVFSQEGVVHPVVTILKVEDKNGKTLEEYTPSEKKVMDPEIARQITSILSDNNARSYVFGANNFLTLGNRPVAAKTGTTNDYKDAWTIGYTPSIVTGVWVGNNNNTAMKLGSDGSVVAAPIWNAYMKQVLDNTPVEKFTAPQPVATGKPVLDGVATTTQIVKIDRASGLLATDYTPASFIVEKAFGQPHNILYYVNKDDPRGPTPTNPTSDPQFALWEAPVQAWAAKNKLIATSTLPTAKDNLHIPANQPTLTINQPANNQSVVDPLLLVSIDTAAPRGVSRVEYYIDNKLFSVNTVAPYGLAKNISFLDNGLHELLIKSFDDIDNSTEQKINFNLALTQTIPSGDVNLNWLEPQTLNYSINSFPISLRLEASNWDQISKINLYYSQNNKPVLINSLAPIETSPVSIPWTKPPKPGSYQVYAEVELWRGVNKQSSPLSITITKSSTSTTP